MNYIQIINDFITKSNLHVTLAQVENFTAYNMSPNDILPFLTFIKTNKQLRFTILTDLFAADFPNNKNRFEVAYSMLSLKLNKRLLIKIQISEEQQVESITKIYSAACWYEREIFDMFGINFNNSPDQRRILTDYGFVGHPLRKDFPVTGHLQVRYDESLEKVIYEPVLLEQEFRNFNFVSPWSGPEKNILPGDEKATK